MPGHFSGHRMTHLLDASRTLRITQKQNRRIYLIIYRTTMLVKISLA